jgi:hypothetical protein
MVGCAGCKADAVALVIEILERGFATIFQPNRYHVAVFRIVLFTEQHNIPIIDECVLS